MLRTYVAYFTPTSNALKRNFFRVNIGVLSLTFSSSIIIVVFLEEMICKTRLTVYCSHYGHLDGDHTSLSVLLGELENW